MSGYKIQRGPIRAAFTKAINELTNELDKAEPDKGILQQLFQRLEGHHNKLLQVNDKVEEAMLLAEDTTEEAFAQEYTSATDYAEKFIAVNQRLKDVTVKEEESETSSEYGSARSSNASPKSKIRFAKVGV
ncbi:hypothetical protein Fcan01_23977 [Folsomia candida]|uniref:Uncharacterized protein n=1 Tax=Folsomia candida TaxID=158441 RepID=A0A226D8W8_FOLCA|nr:hypothetical protein Fcan01_23977 [Folsomia candida]